MLKRVAQGLTAAFRTEDVVARIGGDEFAVLLPNTNADAAKISLQRVRKTIQELNKDQSETPIQLSLGVSTATNPGPLEPVLQEADQKMYQEKRRNNPSLMVPRISFHLADPSRYGSALLNYPFNPSPLFPPASRLETIPRATALCHSNRGPSRS